MFYRVEKKPFFCLSGFSSVNMYENKQSIIGHQFIPTKFTFFLNNSRQTHRFHLCYESYENKFN